MFHTDDIAGSRYSFLPNKKKKHGEIMHYDFVTHVILKMQQVEEYLNLILKLVGHTKKLNETNCVTLKQFDTIFSEFETTQLAIFCKNTVCEQFSVSDDQNNLSIDKLLTTVVRKIVLSKLNDFLFAVSVNDVVNFASKSTENIYKKQKFTNYFQSISFDFDSIPPFEALEDYLSILSQHNDNNESRWNGLLKMELGDLKDHPQWSHLLVLLDQSSRVDFSEEFVCAIYYRFLVGFRDEKQGLDIALATMNHLCDQWNNNNSLTGQCTNSKMHIALFKLVLKLSASALNNAQADQASCLLISVFKWLSIGLMEGGGALRVLQSALLVGSCWLRTASGLSKLLCGFFGQFHPVVLHCTASCGFLGCLDSFLSNNSPSSPRSPSVYFIVALMRAMLAHRDGGQSKHQSPVICRALQGSNGRFWTHTFASDEPKYRRATSTAILAMCTSVTIAQSGLLACKSSWLYSDLSNFTECSGALVDSITRVGLSCELVTEEATSQMLDTCWCLTRESFAVCQSNEVDRLSCGHTVLARFARCLHRFVSNCAAVSTSLALRLAKELNQLIRDSSVAMGDASASAMECQQELLVLWAELMRLLSASNGSTDSCELGWLFDFAAAALMRAGDLHTRLLDGEAQSNCECALHFVVAALHCCPSARNEVAFANVLRSIDALLNRAAGCSSPFKRQEMVGLLVLVSAVSSELHPSDDEPRWSGDLGLEDGDWEFEVSGLRLSLNEKHFESC